MFRADLDTVLGLFITAVKADQKQNYYQDAEEMVKEKRLSFYHACLDRMDHLITEKNSTCT